MLVPFVQVRVPPAGLVAMDRYTYVELSLTTWFSELSTSTMGCWVQTAPGAPPPGWTPKTRWIAPVLLNVATPLTALAVVTPPRVPEAGFDWITSETVA